MSGYSFGMAGDDSLNPCFAHCHFSPTAETGNRWQFASDMWNGRKGLSG